MHRWRIDDGERVDLTTVDPSSTPHGPGSRAEAEAAIPALHLELAGLQERLWAQSTRSLLVVLQGLDASGKDGTIKHVFGALNPQAVAVSSFKEPSAEELSHDFLWRAHRVTPASGRVAIWNRSHYEDVLAARVEGLVAAPEWQARYAQINAFEALLVDRGTAVVKVFLHISADEQRKRFEQRLTDPAKRWKFRQADLDVRMHWKEYRRAYEDAFAQTSTKTSPWYVVPADHKWYRNWVISSLMVDVLRAVDPQYPEPLEVVGPAEIPDV